MTGANTIVAPFPGLRRRAGAAGVSARVEGRRVALVTSAMAVATLPMLLPRGPQNLAPADAFIAFALFACLLWVGTSGRRLAFAYGIPMTLFMAGGALGAMAGPVPGTGAVAIVQDIVLVLWCWTVLNVCSSAHRLEVLLKTWVYSSIVWVVLMFVGLFGHIAYLSGQVAREGSRTALTMGDPNFSANYYVVSIMILWATQRPRRRAGRYAAYALFVCALASTGSNSGMVSIAVALVVAGVLGVYRRSGHVAALAVAAAILLVGFAAKSQINIKSIQNKAHGSKYAFIRDGLGRGEVSVGQRQTLLHDSMQLYRDGGPLGAGPVSTKPRLIAEMAPFVKEAHDDYLAALTERGVLGALGLFLLIGGLLFRATKVSTRRLSPAFSAVLPRPNALAGALAGTLVAGTVYELLHVRHVWTMFAFIAAVFVWGRE
jgi:O-antigen ligase